MRLPSPLELKAWLGGMGLGVVLLGIALGQRWLVWVALVLLTAAFLLRYATRRRPDH